MGREEGGVVGGITDCAQLQCTLLAHLKTLSKEIQKRALLPYNKLGSRYQDIAVNLRDGTLRSGQAHYKTGRGKAGLLARL